MESCCANSVSVFVVPGGKVYHADGFALKRWIAERRQELKGPRGILFRERAIPD